MLNHAITTIWSDNAQLDILRFGDFGFMSQVHCPGMKSSDLIIINIGSDISLCSEMIVFNMHMTTDNRKFIHPGRIGSEVAAHCSHRYWLITQQFHIESNITGTTTKFTA